MPRRPKWQWHVHVVPSGWIDLYWFSQKGGCEKACATSTPQQRLPQKPSDQELASQSNHTTQPWPGNTQASVILPTSTICLRPLGGYWVTRDPNLLLATLHSAPDISQSQRPYATTTQSWCCVKDPPWNVPQGLHWSDWQDIGAPTQGVWYHWRKQRYHWRKQRYHWRRQQ